MFFVGPLPLKKPQIFPDNVALTLSWTSSFFYTAARASGAGGIISLLSSPLPALFLPRFSISFVLLSTMGLGFFSGKLLRSQRYFISTLIQLLWSSCTEERTVSLEKFGFRVWFRYILLLRSVLWSLCSVVGLLDQLLYSTAAVVL